MILLDKRTIVYQRRNALTQKEVEEKSKQIIERLLPYLHGTIAIYMAYGNEVNLHHICSYDVCCVPVTFPQGEMRFYRITKDTKFEKSKHGILEPIHAQEILKKDIDVMVIPMVAFDEQKNRMGHGKGYYDRYLKDFHGEKIGVAFECQKLAQLDVYPHDIPMDLIITEKYVYK